jgi:hypothetical protein
MKDEEVTAAIVRSKTEAHQFMDHPDCPNLERARLYYMFDTTEWSKNNENEDERHLQGNVSGLRKEDDSSLFSMLMLAEPYN